MSVVFRGTRLVFAFGFRGFQCNRLHQRNIASSGLASLSQVTTRREKCFNTSIAPLNRCGIFKSAQTITVQLFSTGLLSCSEKQSGLVTGNASTETIRASEVPPGDASTETISQRLTKKSKYLPNITNKQSEFSIFIGCINFNYSEEYIQELFSQFGTVSGVAIPQKRSYDDDPADADKFKFAFVSFENRESVSRATAAQTVTARDDAIIVIKKNESYNEIPSETERTFRVDEVPGEVTVEQLYEYLNSFEEVERLNLMIAKDQYLKEQENNSALVTFKSVKDMHMGIILGPHNLGKSQSGKSCIITITNIHNDAKIQKYKYRNRDQKVFTSGWSKDTSESDLRTYFGQFGSVSTVEMIFLCDVRATVEFADTNSALLVAKEEWHTIGDENVRVQLLGIVNE